MARAKNTSLKIVSQDIIDQCLAKAIAEGDMVNFRFLFLPYSPLRQDSSENIESAKYAYLIPDEEGGDAYREALALVKRIEMHAHVKAQLEKKGPAQLPSEMLLLLADNAVRLGKYTVAAQAYELLRIRRRIQEEVFAQADAALDANDIPRAVRGYRIATGLEYNYAAFPEPLPAIPNYQTQALMMHAVYPSRPEYAVALQPQETHLKTALNYLLLHAEAAARLDQRPQEQQIEFVVELVRQLDPNWNAFADRYRQTCNMILEFGKRFDHETNQKKATEKDLAEEIAEQQENKDPRQIPTALLGWAIENGAWWQYLKELAYAHPASVLFISRQAVSKDLEIILPRYVKDAILVKRLGLDATA